MRIYGVPDRIFPTDTQPQKLLDEIIAAYRNDDVGIMNEMYPMFDALKEIPEIYRVLDTVTHTMLMAAEFYNQGFTADEALEKANRMLEENEAFAGPLYQWGVDALKRHMD